MQKDTEKTTVIFRRFKDGEIIALFPYEIADKQGNIVSYMHIGQHGAASPLLFSDTLPARPDEYADLKMELEGMGYDLDIKARRSWSKYNKICKTACI